MHLKGGTNPPNRKIVVSTAISPIETREFGYLAIDSSGCYRA